MELRKKTHNYFFLLQQKIRFDYCIQLVDSSAHTLVDYGSMNGKFFAMAQKRGLLANGYDIETDVTITSIGADVVTCFEVLEHVVDPVSAIKNLAQLYKKQLIISVPNEPWFSLWRLGWEREHLWAITPAILKHYLGVPAFEAQIILGRYYVAVWRRH